ncbi:aldo/keto reductase [Chachezhania antarctica]|uniref:aldo/keto reductase n=1 Tax=Chachezhania antarctica TaxID=2340860 RepID=UPI0013CE3F31|nr:aldo/keto reductase [Chachezhania antarctica]|tara:strand:+ start:682 stop:1656 length:975 start_codon:yes stop_codon:yes gene_type:complete
MDQVSLGSTGLTVGAAGLGCGGNSRLGIGYGKSEDEAAGLVEAAFDQGVTFFDTARVYGTEGAVGTAAQSIGRDRMVIATKGMIYWKEADIDEAAFLQNFETSLRELKTDYVDLFSLHGIRPAYYQRARDIYLPILLREKEKGRIRHIGITESGPADPGQEMLSTALAEDDCPWEAVMLAFHMLNQGARQKVFPKTIEKGVGTQLMFVVRNIFSQPNLLDETVGALMHEGNLDPARIDAKAPLGFLLADGHAASLTEAAYRYARHEPGADIVLFGTGNVAHLGANIAAINMPPLPADDVALLKTLFGHLSGVGLDLPHTYSKVP